MEYITRDDMLRGLNLSGIGIEIGVKKGIFSRRIIENTNLYMYLLDAWRYFDSGYIDLANAENQTQIKRMGFTVNHLLPFEGRFTIIRDTSENGSKIFQDNFFDFVYIDGNHSYKACLQDLELWYPKLKSGGIFSGHDYTNIPPSIEVKRAVDEFASKYDIKIQKTVKGKFPSWFTTKP